MGVEWLSQHNRSGQKCTKQEMSYWMAMDGEVIDFCQVSAFITAFQEKLQLKTTGIVCQRSTNQHGHNAITF